MLFVINVIVSQNQSLNTSLFSLFASNLGAKPSEIGVTVFLSGVVATLLMIPSGILAEKFGRKQMMGASAILGAVSTFSYTLTTSWQHLIPCAMLFSASFALFVPARMALVADYSTPQNRVAVYSLTNMAWPIGSIYGPVAGGVLADAFPGWKAPFYFMSLTSLLCLFPSLALKKAPEESVGSDSGRGRRLGREWGFFYGVLFLYIMHLFIELGITAVDPLMPLYLERRFNVTKTQVGIFYSAGFGMATLLSQIPAGFMAGKYGRKGVTLGCLSVVPVFYVLCALTGDYLTIMGYYMLINAFWSMTWPTSMAMLVDAVPASSRGVALGARQAFIRLGATIGPLVGGFLWDFVGLTVPFYASALFFALAVPVLLLVREK
jgi:DHA1 family multidrug resistance protein-like MFS transporter